MPHRRKDEHGRNWKRKSFGKTEMREMFGFWVPHIKWELLKKEEQN
jgi:hypothetical protein